MIQSSSTVSGLLLWTFFFKMLHIFSIILTSGDWVGQFSRIVNPFSQKSFGFLATCVLVRCLAGRVHAYKDSPQHCLSVFWYKHRNLPRSPFDRIQPQTINFFSFVITRINNKLVVVSFFVWPSNKILPPAIQLHHCFVRKNKLFQKFGVFSINICLAHCLRFSQFLSEIWGFLGHILLRRPYLTRILCMVELDRSNLWNFLTALSSKKGVFLTPEWLLFLLFRSLFLVARDFLCFPHDHVFHSEW